MALKLQQAEQGLLALETQLLGRVDTGNTTATVLTAQLRSLQPRLDGARTKLLHGRRLRTKAKQQLMECQLKRGAANKTGLAVAAKLAGSGQAEAKAQLVSDSAQSQLDQLMVKLQGLQAESDSELVSTEADVDAMERSAVDLEAKLSDLHNRIVMLRNARKDTKVDSVSA